MKQTIILLFLAIGLPAISAKSTNPIKDWDYPHRSNGGIGESSDGLLAFGRSSRHTLDPVEKVILWYADRLEVPNNDSLRKHAKEGGKNLDRKIGVRSNYSNNTDTKKNNLQILGTLTQTYAHVTFLYQPNRKKKTDVVISITKVPDGTDVQVIQQLK